MNTLLVLLYLLEKAAALLSFGFQLLNFGKVKLLVLSNDFCRLLCDFLLQASKHGPDLLDTFLNPLLKQ